MSDPMEVRETELQENPSGEVIESIPSSAPEQPAGGPQSASEISSSASDKPPAKGRREADDWLGGIQWLASTVVIAVFVITFLAQAFQIPSESMENTLLIGDYLLVDKVHYGVGGLWHWLLPYRDIQRGDIIVFRYPVTPTQHFVKRVVGLPGDHVRLFHGRVFVNGNRWDDSAFAIHKFRDFDSYRDNFPTGNYLSANVNSAWWIEMHNVVQNGELVVPPDKYFVLGDNRDDSLDSRYWGFVPRENIIGRPLLIYWSVRRPEDSGGDDKLGRLLYLIVHLPEDARWNRTMRLVH